MSFTSHLQKIAGLTVLGTTLLTITTLNDTQDVSHDVCKGNTKEFWSDYVSTESHGKFGPAKEKEFSNYFQDLLKSDSLIVLSSDGKNADTGYDIERFESVHAALINNKGDTTALLSAAERKTSFYHDNGSAFYARTTDFEVVLKDKELPFSNNMFQVVGSVIKKDANLLGVYGGKGVEKDYYYFPRATRTTEKKDYVLTRSSQPL